MADLQLFGTDGIRAKANFYPLDTTSLMQLGKSLAEFTKKRVKPNPNRPYKVIIAKDTRRSGYMIEQILTGAFLSRGVDVMTVGPMPTPALSHLVRSFALDLGIMITASHNPYYDNGIKIFANDGAKLTKDEEITVENFYFKTSFNGNEDVGRAKRIENAAGRYIEFIKATADNISLAGFKIVVDCANGAAYNSAPDVFSELGAKVIPIGIDPNGYNINDNCGALYPEHVKAAVIKEKADLGIALDGDADRVIMVDEKGNIIDGNYITALLAKYLLEKRKLRKNTVVVTTYSNLALDFELQNFGIKVVKVVNGDHEISAMCRERGYNFGGEFSGHFIFFDFTETGDGTLTALMVLKVMQEKKQSLSKLAYTFKKFPQKIFNVAVKDKKPLEELPEFLQKLKSWDKKFQRRGRVFVRYSGTENLLRIMVESEKEADVNNAGEELSKLAKKLLN